MGVMDPWHKKGRALRAWKHPSAACQVLLVWGTPDRRLVGGDPGDWICPRFVADSNPTGWGSQVSRVAFSVAEFYGLWYI